MTEKVKLPQNVADAIEAFRNADISDYGIVIETHNVAKISGLEDEPKVLLNWIHGKDGGNADLLLDALRIGYEVELEYKTGDWVRYWKTDSIPAIGEITHIDHNFNWAKFNNCIVARRIENITRHATPEEIKAEKERRVWVKIGRQVGEFRDGDMRISKENVPTKTKVPDFATGEYFSGELKGFYPAESFVSFEEGESE